MRSDDGVSPVIGVMLMLVITIIIAAVISSFAGGLTVADTAAPKVTFSVTPKVMGESGTMHNGIVIRHTGGDPVDLVDMSVKLTSNDQTITLDYLSDSTIVSAKKLPEQMRNHKSYFAPVGGIQIVSDKQVTLMNTGDSVMVVADGYVGTGKEITLQNSGRTVTGPALYWEPVIGDGYGLFMAKLNAPFKYSVIDKISGKTIQTGSFTLR